MANGAMDDDAEQFSLRWNNFHNNLTCGFHELLEEKDLVDVTLACDGQYVQAHKLVLTVCSPYFKALFKVNPNTHPIVILKDVNFADLQAILQFMYRGEVNVRQEDLTNFLKTAEVLKIKGLTGDDKGPGSSQRSSSIQESSSKTVPIERPPSPPSAPPPAKRKRTQEPPPGISQVPVSHVRTPSPAAAAPQAAAQPSPLPSHSVAPPPDQSDVEYIDVSETKVEPADYVEDDQYSRDDINEDDLSMSASDPLSSSSQMLVPPPLLAGPSTSRDSGSGKEALQGIASFAGVAGPSTQHDAAGPSSQELTSQGARPMSMKMECGVTGEITMTPIGGVCANERYGCNFCDRTYKRKDHLRRHQKDTHAAELMAITAALPPLSQQSPLSSLLVPQTPVKCNYCDQTFTRKEHRSRHERNFHGEDCGPFSCIICFKVFKNARNLQSHMTYRHGRNPAPELEIIKLPSKDEKPEGNAPPPPQTAQFLLIPAQGNNTEADFPAHFLSGPPKEDNKMEGNFPTHFLLLPPTENKVEGDFPAHFLS